MNFLLYMIGRSARRGLGLRPTGRDLLIGTAAAWAAAGEYARALSEYRNLAGALRCTVMDVLICGHLELLAGSKERARDAFARGMGRLLAAPEPTTQGSIERLIAGGERFLQQGRFVRATDCFRRARAWIEVVLSAEAGLVLAQDGLYAGAFGSALRLSDCSLRLLARAQLAGELSRSLQERSLREDLAAWATSDRRVNELLAGELHRLEGQTLVHPGNLETLYRLGLVASAMSDEAKAAAAFGGVLSLHPLHVSTAARLAAIFGRRGENEIALAVLRRAFQVDCQTLGDFAQFAAAAEGPEFDQTVERMCSAAGGEPFTTRANLAFALSEVGLLDGVRESWRESVTA